MVALWLYWISGVVDGGGVPMALGSVDVVVVGDDVAPGVVWPSTPYIPISMIPSMHNIGLIGTISIYLM